MRQEIHARLDHLDECLDTNREIMLERLVTRKELDTYKIEMQAMMTRMREAISADSAGLHERVMRLESRYFAEGKA